MYYNVITENFGKIRPDSVEDYISAGGFAAFKKALSMTPGEIIKEVKDSKLRGRSGSAFPTGIKWEIIANATVTPKYLICNADESEPGTFKDKFILNCDPLKVIEGMMIAAYAIGAKKGYVYVRGEYGEEYEHLNNALKNLKSSYIWDMLSQKGMDFDIELRKGAGAYVCGEETAMIESIEGHRGVPRLRPPYPTEIGLWNCPTLINNVETFATIPFIVNYGADAYLSIGTKNSGGTRLISLCGNVVNRGVYEVPMGISLRDIVYDIGGGIPDDKGIKMLQIGGSAGFCIPPSLLDLPLDFDAFSAEGIGMGSGSILVMDEEHCIVDFVKCILEFFIEESCGKCTPCREGLRQALIILERFSRGIADEGDLRLLKDLALTIKYASNCALGQTSVTAVLTTLKYFEDEYKEHMRGYCRAGICNIQSATKLEVV